MRISAPRWPRRAQGRAGEAARFASARRLVGSRSPAWRAGERWRLDSAPTFCLYSSVESEARWGMGGARRQGTGRRRLGEDSRSSAAAVAAPAAASLASRESLRQQHETRGAWSSLVLALSPLLPACPVALFFSSLSSLCLINNNKEKTVYCTNSKYSFSSKKKTASTPLSIFFFWQHSKYSY